MPEDSNMLREEVPEAVEPAPAESPKEARKPEAKTEDPSPNGKDTPEEKIEGVPYDKDGKRPSDKTIDFEALKERLSPEEFAAVEGRFKSLYRQVKSQDRYLDQLGKDHLLMQKDVESIKSKDDSKTKNIENLTSVVAELSTKDASAQQNLAMGTLKAELAQAYQDMEFGKVAEITARMTELSSRPAPKIEAPEVKQEDPVEAPTQAEPENSLTPRQQSYLQDWASEMDNNGQLLRPWAQNWHPMHDYALEQTKAMMKHPSLAGADMEQILTTVDNVMMAQLQSSEEPASKEEEAKPKPVAPEVISGDTNIRTTKSEDKVTLSAEQKQVAGRLFSKLSPKEAQDKYLSSLIKTQKLQN